MSDEETLEILEKIQVAIAFDATAIVTRKEAVEALENAIKIISIKIIKDNKGEKK